MATWKNVVLTGFGNLDNDGTTALEEHIHHNLIDQALDETINVGATASGSTGVLSNHPTTGLADNIYDYTNKAVKTLPWQEGGGLKKVYERHEATQTYSTNNSNQQVAKAVTIDKEKGASSMSTQSSFGGGRPSVLQSIKFNSLVPGQFLVPRWSDSLQDVGPAGNESSIKRNGMGWHNAGDNDDGYLTSEDAGTFTYISTGTGDNLPQDITLLAAPPETGDFTASDYAQVTNFDSGDGSGDSGNPSGAAGTPGTLGHHYFNYLHNIFQPTDVSGLDVLDMDAVVTFGAGNGSDIDIDDFGGGGAAVTTENETGTGNGPINDGHWDNHSSQDSGSEGHASEFWMGTSDLPMNTDAGLESLQTVTMDIAGTYGIKRFEIFNGEQGETRTALAVDDSDSEYVVVKSDMGTVPSCNSIRIPNIYNKVFGGGKSAAAIESKYDGYVGADGYHISHPHLRLGADTTKLLNSSGTQLGFGTYNNSSGEWEILTYQVPNGSGGTVSLPLYDSYSGGAGSLQIVYVPGGSSDHDYIDITYSQGGGLTAQQSQQLLIQTIIGDHADSETAPCPKLPQHTTLLWKNPSTYTSAGELGNTWNPWFAMPGRNKLGWNLETDYVEDAAISASFVPYAVDRDGEDRSSLPLIFNKAQQRADILSVGRASKEGQWDIYRHEPGAVFTPDSQSTTHMPVDTYTPTTLNHLPESESGLGCMRVLYTGTAPAAAEDWDPDNTHTFLAIRTS